MRKINLEMAVGVFVLLGLVSLAVLSIKYGRLEVMGGDTYTVYARFERAGGIKAGSTVEIAGVQVGRVKAVELDEDYLALVRLALRRDIKIQEDSIASIKTKGLIGEKYIQISPGGFDEYIGDGGELIDTESAVDIEALISQFVFGKI